MEPFEPEEVIAACRELLAEGILKVLPGPVGVFVMLDSEKLPQDFRQSFRRAKLGLVYAVLSLQAPDCPERVREASARAMHDIVRVWEMQVKAAAYN